MPFVTLGAERPLNLAQRGALRALIDGQYPEELSDAIEAMASAVESLVLDTGLRVSFLTTDRPGAVDGMRVP